MTLSLGKSRFYSASLIALASSASAGARANNSQSNSGARVTNSLEIITNAASLKPQIDTGSGLPTPPTDIVATEWASLYFGVIAPNASAGGAVDVSYMSAQTCGAGLTCMSDTHHAARFEIMGETGYSYIITVDGSTTVQNDNTDVMNVSNITLSHTTGVLVEGYSEFYVGGTLSVGASQPTGNYTGTYQVTVNYQ
jgi:hypothetical protein